MVFDKVFNEIFHGDYKVILQSIRNEEIPVDYSNNHGESILFWITELAYGSNIPNKYYDIAIELIRLGANPYKTNQYNDSPVDVATVNGNQRLLDIITKPQVF